MKNMLIYLSAAVGATNCVRVLRKEFGDKNIKPLRASSCLTVDSVHAFILWKLFEIMQEKTTCLYSKIVTQDVQIGNNLNL